MDRYTNKYINKNMNSVYLNNGINIKMNITKLTDKINEAVQNIP